jgi:uncharacterized membrane protein
MKSSLFISRLLVIASPLFFALHLYGQEPTIRKQTNERGEIEWFHNSSTLSQAIAINNQGSVIGTREVPDKAGAMWIPRPFYSGTFGTKDIPTPNAYTNFEPIGISDTELVIGYATRPSGSKDGSLIGTVWDPKQDAFTLLPKAEGDNVNHPQAISADGKRITGYTTGPNRLRPALWEYDPSQQQWSITVLPTQYENNPYLMSGGLMISPDGKSIAGCCTEGTLPDGSIDSALYRWAQGQSGAWERSLLSREQLYLRGINDQAEMAGSVRGPTGLRQPCFVSAKGEFVLLPLLPNDVSGEAKGINNASLVVGFSDDPNGGDGGPEPCIWGKDRKATRIAKAGFAYGAIQAVNQKGQIAGMAEVGLNDLGLKADPLAESVSLAFRTLHGFE